MPIMELSSSASSKSLNEWIHETGDFRMKEKMALAREALKIINSKPWNNAQANLTVPLLCASHEYMFKNSVIARIIILLFFFKLILAPIPHTATAKTYQLRRTKKSTILKCVFFHTKRAHNAKQKQPLLKCQTLVANGEWRAKWMLNALVYCCAMAKWKIDSSMRCISMLHMACLCI